MARISIVGTSGSGKSTVGRAAAERLGVPFLELDSLRHQANWEELPDDEFRARTAEVVAGEGWVVDGNYSAVRRVVRERATQIVWLDLPRWRVMLQVVPRTLVRVALRRELWNGNRERWRNLFTLDPLESIIMWAWTTHGRRRREYAGEVDDTWVRLRSRREVKAWLDSL
ncbi:MAG TPA: shikimate kinase [Acidimicrobiales bacterium]|nr:shikimate kinase [Acidimicrobiales bacterium]